MHDHKQEHFKEGMKATKVSILLNLLLAIFKFIAGIFGHSQAMVADAAHSFSDLITDFTVFIGLKIAKRPKDATHPYGHGKIETLVGFIVGFVLLGIGIEIFIEACGSFKKAIEVPTMLALWAAVTSIIFKEFLYQYNMRIGRHTNSPAVIANAWHHRSDAMSSVAALIGIGAARMGYLWMDPVVAILVGLVVARVALKILWETGKELSEERIDPKLIVQIKKIVKGVPGVKSLHKLRSRKLGAGMTIDLHIQVSPTLTVKQGHDIAEKVEESVEKGMPNIESVLVHIEPYAKK